MASEIRKRKLGVNSTGLALAASVGPEKSQLQRNAAELLEILYFVHDKGISAIGATMRGRLSRTQASILWLIRAEGEDARGMLRKEVARRLHNWFDLGNPAITTALQTLAEPPLRLVRVIENADSAREKKVILTAKGERFVASMAERGQRLVRQLISDLEQSLSQEEISVGLEFLRASVSFFQRIYPARKVTAQNRAATNGSGSQLKTRRRAWKPRSAAEKPSRDDS